MGRLGRLRKCKCLLESTTIEVAFFTKASPVQGEVAFSQENDGRVVTIFWLMKDRTNPSVSHSLDSSVIACNYGALAPSLLHRGAF